MGSVYRHLQVAAFIKHDVRFRYPVVPESSSGLDLLYQGTFANKQVHQTTKMY